MPDDSAILMVLCQRALGITQQEMADLLGKDRRTIQRWQDKGCAPHPTDAAKLANALRPTRADLADQVLALGRAMAASAGMVTPEVIAEILQAAAQVGGTTPEAIRPVVAAAFVKAVEAGVDATGVAARLTGIA